MLKKLICTLILLCTATYFFSSCLEMDDISADNINQDEDGWFGSSDDETETQEITVTMDESDFKGMLYTEAEEKLREMGFTIFEYETIETAEKDKVNNTISSIEIKNWIFGKGNFSAGDTFKNNATVTLWYYICDEPVNTLTPNTCPELAALLTLKDSSDPSVASFSKNYRGQVIEFDGCITAMQNHDTYKTRYDVMIGSGNFDENNMRGPNFRLTDVNYYDMNVTGGDSIYVGLNVHIIAKVGAYNSNTTLFELEIISIEIKK